MTASQGRYCNGDPFLVNTSGVSFSSITPASADVSGRWTNGAMLNYGEGDGPSTQGLDGYVPAAGQYIAYDAVNNVDPGKTGSALRFSSGVEGSVLKAVATTTPDPTQNARDRIDFVGVMTVCAVSPPANSFRPGIAAPSKVSSWIESDMDLGLLRNLTLPSSAPSATNHLQSQRWPLMCWTTSNDPGRTNRGVKNHVDYGPDIARDTATAILLMNCDIDSTVKRNLAVSVVQRGIDIYARAIEGGDWSNGGGGTGNGRKLALAFAAHMLDDAGMKAYCDKAVHPIWTEDDQLVYVSAGDVATYDYEAGDLGMPEWQISTASPSRSETTSYRQVNTNWISGSMLAMMLIGGKTVWANDAAFDYADRIMERTYFDGSGTSQWALSLSGTNSPPQFHRDMWANFRLAAGMPAIWNW